MKLPSTQHAVQLVRANELRVNATKPVLGPVGTQILARVEATSLCFSDLKLLKQFSDHPRKSAVMPGLVENLPDNPAYVPGELATVPGHETVVRIVAVGTEVKEHRVGERCLVQTDYRALKTTAGSNAAFGYNFEGGLQEYVIIDERVSRDAETGERLLLPVNDERSAAAICLVEPWACVEDSYITSERQTIKPHGQLLVVAEPGTRIAGLKESFGLEGPPVGMLAVCPAEEQRRALSGLGPAVVSVRDLAELGDQKFDDIVYFGAQKDTVEKLNNHLANRGIVNIVTAGQRIGAPVAVGVGRIHYGLTRWIGTRSANAAESYRVIPSDGEIRDHDRILVVGAGGPMGQMHVIRNICAGQAHLRITATDFDDARLEALSRMAMPLAKGRYTELHIVNSKRTQVQERPTYIAIMVPAPELVARAIADAADGCRINVFAGIPAPTIHELDLDSLIAKGVFLFGTSGSTLRDMKRVLYKVETNQLDTNCCVAAVCGIAGVIEGVAAMEDRTLSGKTVVYPALPDLPLTPLSRLEQSLPNVATKLDGGRWCKAAEDELLKTAQQ